MKRILNHIFIDGLSGMASGLFRYADYRNDSLAGRRLCRRNRRRLHDFYRIGGESAYGCGNRRRHCLQVSGADSGRGVGGCGGNGRRICRQDDRRFVLADGSVVLAGAGDPLGAFIASVAAVEIGILISGRTGLDIVLTPVSVIAAGSAVGIAVGPPCSALMTYLR